MTLVKSFHEIRHIDILLVMTCNSYNTSKMADKGRKQGVLDKHNPVPLYYQLKNLIEEHIASGEYKPGDPIPSENQLCEQYNISRTTVRQAISELVSTGKLTRTQGRGTFVSTPVIEKPAYRLTGFTQDMKDLGKNPHSKTLLLAPIMPPHNVREALLMEENEAAIILKRQRFSGDAVLGLDISYFSFKRFYKLLDEDLSNTSLYQVLQNKFTTVPSRSNYNISSMRCPREIANLVDLEHGDPILFFRELVFDQNGIPFEFGEEYYRSDRFIFRVEIRKHEDEYFRGVVV